MLIHALRQELVTSQALRRQKTLRDEALDHLADAITIVSDTAELIYANAQTSHLSNGPATAFLPQNLRQLLLSEQDEDIDSLLADAVRHGSMRRKMNIRKAEHEAPMPVEVVGSILPGGRILLSFRDISERVRLTEELDAARERFADFSTSAAEWFWETDNEDRFAYVTDSVSAHLGVEP